jgi:hypothetical protein
MPITPAHYSAAITTDLTDRTAYEAWLLESVYDLASQPIAVSDNDDLIYPANGGDPQAHHCGTGNAIIGDWKQKFLEAGTPLVFVTTYKLLDMMIEWVLHQNINPVPRRFVEKIAALGRPIVFPELIESRQWLRERLIALYEELAPLRNTIIHSRQFQSTNGTLGIQPDKWSFFGKTVTITASNVRTFAVVMVSLVHYLEQTWRMDYFQEKMIRRALDDLAHLHRKPSLRQQEPVFQSVRVYRPDEDPIEIDVQQIRDKLAELNPAKDVEFQIRLIAVARDGQTAAVYLLDRDRLQPVGQQLQMSRADRATSVEPLPNGIDPMASAVAMGLVVPVPVAPPNDP